MSREQIHLSVRFGTAIALPLCLLLSACGGDGSYGVAGTPPPPVTPTPTPTPTPTTAPWGEIVPAKTQLTTINGYSINGSLSTKLSWLDSPATLEGTYDVIGILSLTPASGGPTSRAVAPEEFTMSTGMYFGRDSGDDPLYSLTTPQNILPGGRTSLANVGVGIADSWTITPTAATLYNWLYGSTRSQGLGQTITAFDKAADGSERALFSYAINRGSASWLQPLETGKQLRTTLDYDIGYSYVAMGEWSWAAVDLKGASAGDSGSLLFVNGDRTLASGIPASGTATYDARGLNFATLPFTLTADFSRRTMAALIDQDYRYDPAGDSMDYPLAFGIHVSGSAPFSNDGLFDIPLSGTANFASSYAINTPQAPSAEVVSGTMNGAFFGPNAEQVGGTFFLNRSTGVQMLQDAFVGQQRKP